MQLVICFVILAISWTEAGAGCYGMLFKNGINLYKKEDLSTIVYSSKSPTIAIPELGKSFAINNVDEFMVRNDCKGTFLGKCTDLPSQKGNVIRAIALDVDQVCWHSGFVRVSECEIFSYTPLLPNQSMGAPELQPSCLTVAAARLMDEEHAKSFKKPAIKNQLNIPATFDRTWQAIIETLSESNIPIKTIDKASGIIISDEIADSRKDISTCPYVLTGSVNLTFNIFLKMQSDSAVVKINTSISGVRDGTKIICYSNGALERKLLDRINELVLK